MTSANEDILDEAARWQLACAGPDVDAVDWDTFTEWLEADARHRAAFDEIALSDALLATHAVQLAATFTPIQNNEQDEENPFKPARVRRWPLWTSGSLAASLAALVLVWQIGGQQSVDYVGGRVGREIVLDDGSLIALAPDSRITLSGRNKDHLSLDGGAFFAIRHDPARTLTIRAGALTITDIGTQFDIQTSGEAVRVAVAEGAVQLRSPALGDPVTLAAGRRFEFDPAIGRATLAPAAPASVGQWRSGRLTYDGTPLALVADDLARYAHVQIQVSPVLDAHRFSGTVTIRDGDGAVRGLAQIMDLHLVRDGGTYRLEP